MLVLIALVVFMSLSLVNFGKGLKDRGKAGPFVHIAKCTTTK